MDLIVLKRNEEDNIMYIIEENKFETYNLQNELHTFIKRKVYYLFWRL